MFGDSSGDPPKSNCNAAGAGAATAPTRAKARTHVLRDLISFLTWNVELLVRKYTDRAMVRDYITFAAKPAVLTFQGRFFTNFPPTGSRLLITAVKQTLCGRWEKPPVAVRWTDPLGGPVCRPRARSSLSIGTSKECPPSKSWLKTGSCRRAELSDSAAAIRFLRLPLSLPPPGILDAEKVRVVLKFAYARGRRSTLEANKPASGLR